MAFERAIFESLMKQSVVVRARTGHNTHGEASYSTTSSTFRARVVRRPGQVRDTEGNVVRYGTIAWVASTGTINVTDKVTLPDGTFPPLLSVEMYPDEDGNHHAKLLFGY